MSQDLSKSGKQLEPNSPHVDVSVKQTEDLTGIPRVDAWIKVVKYLGFPVAVAGFALMILNTVVIDYREYIKESARAQKTTSEAVVKGVDVQASTSRAIWQFNQGQQAVIKNQEVQIVNTEEQVANSEKTHELLQEMIRGQEAAARVLAREITAKKAIENDREGREPLPAKSAEEP